MNLAADFYHSICIPLQELAQICSRNDALDPRFNIAKTRFFNICTSLYHFPTKAGLSEKSLRALNASYAAIGDISNTEKHTNRDDPKSQTETALSHAFEYEETKGYRFLELKIVFNYPGQKEEDGIATLLDATYFLIEHLDIDIQHPSFFPSHSKEWKEYPVLYTGELSEKMGQISILTLKRTDADQLIPFDTPSHRLVVLNPDNSVFSFLEMPNKFEEIRKTYKDTTIKFEGNKINLYDKNGKFLQTLDGE